MGLKPSQCCNGIELKQTYIIYIAHLDWLHKIQLIIV